LIDKPHINDRKIPISLMFIDRILINGNTEVNTCKQIKRCGVMSQTELIEIVWPR
jgi:hypothetical protein